MNSLLVYAFKSRIAYEYDCLNCKNQPNVCKSLLGLKAQILDTAFSSAAERCRLKTFIIFQNIGVCTSFHSLPSSPFHHSSSVIYSMHINVKRVISCNHSSCIYYLFINQINNLFMWAIYSAEWVICSSICRWQLVILLGYLFYVSPFESLMCDVYW